MRGLIHIPESELLQVIKDYVDCGLAVEVGRAQDGTYSVIPIEEDK